MQHILGEDGLYKSFLHSVELLQLLDYALVKELVCLIIIWISRKKKSTDLLTSLTLYFLLLIWLLFVHV